MKESLGVDILTAKRSTELTRSLRCGGRLMFH